MARPSKKAAAGEAATVAASSDDDGTSRGTGRFTGTAEQLADVLMAHAKTPIVCMYQDENPNCGAAKVHHGPRGIEGSVKLMADLRSLCDNMSFQKLNLQEALRLVLNRKRTDHDSLFKLTPDEEEDWIKTVCARVRNVCRVTQQGMIKSPQAPWVLALPWVRGSGVAASTAAAPADAAAVVYEYGYMKDLKVPFRVAAGSSHKDLGLPLKPSVSALPTDEVIAEWPDGHSHPLTGLTNEMLGMQHGQKKMEHVCYVVLSSTTMLIHGRCLKTFQALNVASAWDEMIPEDLALKHPSFNDAFLDFMVQFVCLRKACHGFFGITKQCLQVLFGI